MILEFLILIGVFAIMLEQIRRLRALVAQQKAAYEAQIAALQAAINNPDIQAELDAFEAEVNGNPGSAS